MLRLHPDDIGVIETLQTSSADPSGKLTAVTLKADPSVSRGGCHLETPHGDIDASIETRLKRVYQTLVHLGLRRKIDDGYTGWNKRGKWIPSVFHGINITRH